MKILICVLCKEHYNTNTKLPLLLPNCGHTFCKECLEELISKNPETLTCPEDNLLCEFYSSEKKIKSFPVNFALQKYLVSQTEESSDEEDIIQEEFTNQCPIHDQELTLVCLTDKILICSDCALFGTHKDHNFVKKEKLIQDMQTKLSILQDSLNLMEKEECFKEILFLQQHHLKINKIREQKIDDIQQQFQKLKDYIEEKEKQVLFNIKQRFEIFSNEDQQLQQLQKQILNQQKNVQKETKKLQQNYENEENLNQILRQLKDEEKNIFTQKEEMMVQIQKLKNHQEIIMNQYQNSFTFNVNFLEIQNSIEKNIQMIQKNNLNSQSYSLDLPHKTPKKVFNMQQNKETPQKSDKKKRYFSLKQEEDNIKCIKKGNVSNFITSQNASPRNFDQNSFYKNINTSGEVFNSRYSQKKLESNKILLDDQIDQDNQLLDLNNEDSEISFLETPLNFNQASRHQSQNFVYQNDGFFNKNKRSFHQRNISNFKTPITNLQFDNYHTRKISLLSQNQMKDLQIHSVKKQKNLQFNNLYDTENLHPKKMQYIYTPNHRGTFFGGNDKSKKTPSGLKNIKVPPFESDFSKGRRTTSELILAKMKLDDTKIPKLVRKLKKSSTIKNLNLNENQITSKGLKFLFDNLNACKTNLEKIYLKNNCLDETSINCLINFSNQYQSLKFIDIQGNKIKRKSDISKLKRCFSKKGITLIIQIILYIYQIDFSSFFDNFYDISRTFLENTASIIKININNTLVNQSISLFKNNLPKGEKIKIVNNNLVCVIIAHNQQYFLSQLFLKFLSKNRLINPPIVNKTIDTAIKIFLNFQFQGQTF